MWKFEQEFRKEEHQTIGEIDKVFDLDNYKDWLELKLEESVNLLKSVMELEESKILSEFEKYKGYSSNLFDNEEWREFDSWVDCKKFIKKFEFTIEDILDAVQYGFDYHIKSMNDGKSVPTGNILQHLMWRKKLKEVPEEFKSLTK